MTKITITYTPGTKFGAVTAIGPYYDAEARAIWMPQSATAEPAMLPRIMRDRDTGEWRQMHAGLGSYWLHPPGVVEVWHDGQKLYAFNGTRDVP